MQSDYFQPQNGTQEHMRREGPGHQVQFLVITGKRETNTCSLWFLLHTTAANHLIYKKTQTNPQYSWNLGHDVVRWQMFLCDTVTTEIWPVCEINIFSWKLGFWWFVKNILKWKTSRITSSILLWSKCGIKLGNQAICQRHIRSANCSVTQSWWGFCNEEKDFILVVPLSNAILTWSQGFIASP